MQTETTTYPPHWSKWLEKEYPTEWSEWLKKEADGWFHTNRALVDNPELVDWTYEDWFNPFTEPEKLAERRKNSGMNGLKWQRYCEEHYPGIDAKEQKRLRIAERKEDAKSHCGEMHYRKSIKCPGKTESKRWFCSIKGCPTCDNKTKNTIERSLERVIGNVYELTEDQAKDVISSRTKDQYKRFVDEQNGKVFIVLGVDDGIDGLPCEHLTKDVAKKLANVAVACETKRMSGSLGSVSAPVVEKEPTDEIPVKIKRRPYRLDLTDESTIKDHKELDELVLVEFEKVTDTNEDILQDAIYRLEKLTYQIAEKHCAKIHFLITETISVYMSEIDWGLILKE